MIGAEHTIKESHEGGGGGRALSCYSCPAGCEKHRLGTTTCGKVLALSELQVRKDCEALYPNKFNSLRYQLLADANIPNIDDGTADAFPVNLQWNCSRS